MSAVAKVDWHSIVKVAELVFIGICAVFGFLLLYFKLCPLLDW